MASESGASGISYDSVVIVGSGVFGSTDGPTLLVFFAGVTNQ